ncbi:MAG TPA: peptidyl-prolyl cis-trans isomerase [Pirellulales bacterium]|nr:peptidyl-prolyl cis-trans isomerase [Pirellulales bacterium]
MNEFRATHLRGNCVKSIAPMVVLAVIASSVIKTLLADEAPPIVFEADEILAKVDSEVILAGDVVLGAVADFNKVKGKIPSRDREASYRQALKSQIASLVKVKLLYLQAKKNIPEIELSELIERIERDFDDGALKDFLDRTDCENWRELEAKLKSMGSSIERVKRNYVESQLAQRQYHDQVNEDDIEVTREEALARYQENQSKYEYPAKARYEELVMKPSEVRNDRQARAALAQMGESVKKGAAWADVAKARSEGTTAAEGGRQPAARKLEESQVSREGPTAAKGNESTWISQGSHRSAIIDEALFSLAVGAMSPILKDDRGLYIIRVIEREPAGIIPFEEFEDELVREIRRERVVEQQVECMKQLFAEARIWSMFDKQGKQNAGHPPLGPSSERRR